jgi:hypothetical protein
LIEKQENDEEDDTIGQVFQSLEGHQMILCASYLKKSVKPIAV